MTTKRIEGWGAILAAARAAAGDAGAALKPTVLTIQESASDLVRRMATAK